MGRPIYMILEYGYYYPLSDGTNDDPKVFNYNSDKQSPYFNGDKPYPLNDQDYYYNNNIPISIKSCRHISSIVGVIKKYSQDDFDIYVVPYMYGEEFMKKYKNDIFVCSCSVGSYFNPEWMSVFKQDIYMAISASNDGKLSSDGKTGGEGAGSSYDFFTPIGAINTTTGKPEYYSSWGRGLVQFVGRAGEKIKFKYFGDREEYIQGTSFACPEHCAQIMKLMMALYKKRGIKPSMKEVLSLRNRYVKDVYFPDVEGTSEGKDLRTGWGLYIYEDRQIAPIKEMRLKINDVNVTVLEDGVERKVVLDTPATKVNNRTLVPVRFISEELGVIVNWDEKTQTVILTKY